MKLTRMSVVKVLGHQLILQTVLWNSEARPGWIWIILLLNFKHIRMELRAPARVLNNYFHVLLKTTSFKLHYLSLKCTGRRQSLDLGGKVYQIVWFSFLKYTILKSNLSIVSKKWVWFYFVLCQQCNVWRVNTHYTVTIGRGLIC